MTPERRRVRAAGTVMLAGVTAFALCMAVAVSRYPGGSAYGADTASYAFWRNFWCDLMRPVAVDGASNLDGFRWARAGTGAFGLAALAFWYLHTLYLPALRARLLRGLASAAGLGVVLSATLADTAWHAPVVVAAGTLGVGASLLAWTAPTSASLRALGAITLAAAAVNLVQYVREAYLGAPPQIWLPGVQKLATLLWLTWCVAAALWAWRRAT